MHKVPGGVDVLVSSQPQRTETVYKRPGRCGGGGNTTIMSAASSSQEEEGDRSGDDGDETWADGLERDSKSDKDFCFDPIIPETGKTSKRQRSVDGDGDTEATDSVPLLSVDEGPSTMRSNVSVVGSRAGQVSVV